MICSACGSDLVGIQTDLPFQIDETTLVTIPDLPVLRCPHCGECVLEDSSMARVDEVVSKQPKTVPYYW